MSHAPEYQAEDIDTEHDGGLFVTDAELIRRLNVPRKIGYRAIRELEKRDPGRPPFPQKDPLFGGRRLWPAVEKYLKLRHGLTDQPFIAAPQWQENQNATAKTGTSGGDRDAGPQMEAAKETLERVLDRAAGHRRKRLSHKKPVLVVHRNPADINA